MIGVGCNSGHRGLKQGSLLKTKKKKYAGGTQRKLQEKSPKEKGGYLKMCVHDAVIAQCASPPPPPPRKTQW